MVRAWESGARGRGFDPHSGRPVVSLSKIHLLPKRTGNTKEAVTSELTQFRHHLFGVNRSFVIYVQTDLCLM